MWPFISGVCLGHDVRAYWTHRETVPCVRPASRDCDTGSGSIAKVPADLSPIQHPDHRARSSLSCAGQFLCGLHKQFLFTGCSLLERGERTALVWPKDSSILCCGDLRRLQITSVGLLLLKSLFYTLYLVTPLLFLNNPRLIVLMHLFVSLPILFCVF